MDVRHPFYRRCSVISPVRRIQQVVVGSKTDKTVLIIMMAERESSHRTKPTVVFV